MFLRQNRLISKEVQHEKTLNEIEQTFTGYLLEMKDENEQFLKQFEKISQTASIPAQPDDLPSESVMTVKTTRNLAAAAYKKPQKNKPESISDRARHLAHQGYTVEEVARELKKGKTEVELMLKFRQS
ncbi:hypothetical protein UFB30_05885 [Jeotgalibacillus sp. HH7-29]|uniref:Uncharacterized protein n=1 Tax=Jeotgalibacillus haloalkalitolerans TaxID=3104292 RepID=A0ABU5KKE9_9BACL|nr:hypothetical protein [Jeotgalibacillus sp. HH7-29]